MSEKTTWVIGGGQDCDLVVDLPSVSRHHCRLSRAPDGSFLLEDLGSTNGTFVNGRRIVAVTPVVREDPVTLGFSVPMPWPFPPSQPLRQAPVNPRVIRVGRETDNDLVIDSPEVSGHHARVVISEGATEGYVEDLGSTNGTAVGYPDSRVTRATIKAGDTLYFGPVAVPAARFFPPGEAPGLDGVSEIRFAGPVLTVGRDPGCDRVLDFPVVSGRHARFVRAGGTLTVEDLGSSNGTFVNGRRIETSETVTTGSLIGFGSYVVRFVDAAPPCPPEVGIPATTFAAPIPFATSAAHAATPYPPVYGIAVGFCLAVQSVVLAGLIHALGRISTPSALFGLGLAAVWVGVTSAFFERFLAVLSGTAVANGRAASLEVAGSVTRAALVSLAYAIPLLGFVPSFASEPGSWVAACVVIELSTLLGAAAGLVVVRLGGRRSIRVPAATGLILLMGVLCLPLVPSPALGPVGRLVASALPTRWTFEALLLLSVGEKADDPAVDPVEPFFPAATQRAGTAACATALLAMLGALLYADALIALYRPGPSLPASR